jgi:phosphate-selective porin OprO/OprP
MKGKTALMASVAAIALVASVGAAEAKHHAVPDADASASASASESKGPSNAELAARLQAVEDALAADEAKADSDHTRLSALDQDFHDTQWSFDNARPTVKSGDGRFTMAFRVRFQGDFAGFMQDRTHASVPTVPPGGSVSWTGSGDLSSGAVFRRAYFGVEGRAFKDFWYELRLNAGGSDGGNQGATGVPNAGEGDPLLNKAVITYTGIPNFHINFGVLEPNFMFEGTTSSAWLTFMERPEIDNIGADAFGAGDSRRGIEMNFQKTDFFWAGDNVNLTAALTGGKTGSANSHGNGGDENDAILGRVSDRLWTDGPDNFQIGASASNIIYSGGVSGGVSAVNGVAPIRLRDRPEIRVDGTRLIDTGNIGAKHGFMYAFDAGFNFDSLFLGGEYAHFTVDRRGGAFVSGSSTKHMADHPEFSGWYVEGSYFLTGETRAYSASALNNEVGGWEGPVAIASPFSLDGDSWGAWEVAARYSDTDLNWHLGTIPGLAAGTTGGGIAGGREGIVDIALNWYLNKDIRFMFDDMIVHLSKQSAVGVLGSTYTPSGGASAVTVHPQGQDLNIVGMRLQFAN